MKAKKRDKGIERNETLILKLNTEEKERLEETADLHGFTMSTFVRLALNNYYNALNNSQCNENQ